LKIEINPWLRSELNTNGDIACWTDNEFETIRKADYDWSSLYVDGKFNHFWFMDTIPQQLKEKTLLKIPELRDNMKGG